MTDSAIWNPQRETISRQDIEQAQLERLQATVNRVYRNVHFYRRMFDELELAPEDFSTLTDLHKLPFTTKADLRKSYPYDMFALPLREVVRLHASSGTTGMATVVGYTANDLHDWTELVARNLVAGGVTRDDVVQIFFGYGLFSGGFGLHQGAELIGASVIPVSSADIERQVKIMQDFRTTILIGLPSYALQMAQAIEELGLSPNALSLRAGIFGGEPWSEETRIQIEERLHIRATDIYGLAEIGGPGVAGECEFRCGLHIAEDHFIVEVVDPESGELVAPGEVGELVFTTLHKEAFPLLRFRTGDLAQVEKSPCQCGRTTARMSRVNRRTDDMLILHGENIFPADIAQAIAQHPGLGPRFRLIADRPDGEDTLEVEVELSSVLANDTIRSIEALERELAERLQRLVGFEVQVIVTESRTFTGTGEKSGLVIDRRRI